MNVEIGAGARPTRGFIGVDANPAVKPTVLADATALPFKSGTVHRLRAIDCLEHLSYRDTDGALAEWARVCAPRAEVFIQVPSADTIMEWYAARDDRLLNVPPDLPRTHLMGAQWRLYGGHADGVFVEKGDKWWFNGHAAMFSRSSLELALIEAGFTVDRITMNGHPNLLCNARRAA